MSLDPYAAPGPQIRTMTDEDPRLGRAIDAVAGSQKAALVFGYLEDYLVGRQKRLDTELFTAIEAEASLGVISALVHQKHEVHLFVKNLEAHIKGGVTAARVLQPMMDLQHGNEPPRQ